MGTQCSDLVSCGKASDLPDQRDSLSNQSTPHRALALKRELMKEKLESLKREE